LRGVEFFWYKGSSIPYENTNEKGRANADPAFEGGVDTSSFPKYQWGRDVR
jgi:hypothetical protein